MTENRASDLCDNKDDPNQFETERFDLLSEDRVCVADYRFGHNRQGQRDVWIESSNKGKRLLSQITSEGETYTGGDGLNLTIRPSEYNLNASVIQQKAIRSKW